MKLQSPPTGKAARAAAKPARHVNSARPSVAAPSAPTLPVNDGGIVKNSTGSMNDTDARKFAVTQNAAMDNNPNYTTVMPTLDAMNAGILDLQTKDENVRLAKVALADAFGQRVVSRATLDALLKARASYVQMASNGNTSVILSSGFPVRATPGPVGQLDAPQNVSVDLNGTPGVMLLSWDPVTNARAYNVQMSPADTMERDWTPVETCSVTKRRLSDMTLGKVYAFRIAAVGGSTGQSEWSAEAVRMAA